MRIYLDAGHGGSNPGCQYDDLSEKMWTLEFCRDFLRPTLLADAKAAHFVALSRSADVTMTFTDRADNARRIKMDVALVVHVNAHYNPSPRGLRVYVMPGADITALSAAQRILDTVPDALRGSRQIQRASLDGKGDDVVLREYHKRNIPAALVEAGFASNADDRRYLVSHEGKIALAAAITSAMRQVRI